MKCSQGSSARGPRENSGNNGVVTISKANNRPHGYFAVVETLDFLLHSRLFPHLHFWSTIKYMRCNKQEMQGVRRYWKICIKFWLKSFEKQDRLCGIVVRFPCYRSRGPGLYQIFREVVDLERCSLSLVSTTVELLGRKGSGCGLKILEYGGRDPPRWPRGTLYPPNLAITSQISGGRSVGVVWSRTQTTDLFIIITLEKRTQSIECLVHRMDD
jgi:hypothetical protein